MEANKLMMGDWVVWATRSTKIDGIAEGGFSVHLKGEGWRSVDTVEPIKLTPEILEKNGFEVYEQDFTGNTVYKFGWLDYMEFEGFNKYFDIGSKITYRHLGREMTYIHPLMRIYFVHELQHALRLCGIEKEIEL